MYITCMMKTAKNFKENFIKAAIITSVATVLNLFIGGTIIQIAEAINCYSCNYTKIPYSSSMHLKLSQDGCQLNPIPKRYLRTFQSKYKPGQEKDRLRFKDPFCHTLTARTEDEIIEIYRFGGGFLAEFHIPIPILGENKSQRELNGTDSVSDTLDVDIDDEEESEKVNHCLNVTEIIKNISHLDIQYVKGMYEKNGFNLTTLRFDLCYCNDADGCNSGLGS